MRGFSGFPAGQLAQTELPQFVFTDLLPLIDDLAELKVTLHALWLLGQKSDKRRFVQQKELLADERLRAGLSVSAIESGIERAVARGSLLHVIVEQGGISADWYIANDEPGRDFVQRVRSGNITDFDDIFLDDTGVRAQRPNIFVLYEQNIGLLQPLIADELREAERRYPPEWIESAFRIAVEQNKRSWRYIRAILDRWATDGPDFNATPATPNRTSRSSSTPPRKGSGRADPFAW